ncbi:MAG TPA: PQQ-binding-like beta-propeller repeat protein, partial [Polyangiales bacterium]|nr:PQQ-binding-like beta-propeller repeat protein [Polyangiales bacterium]
GNDVFALDETSGSTVWTKHLGDSPTANGVGCGNIHPLGILSTPVIDAASKTIFVAGAIGTNSIARHEVHALSIDDGSSRSGWPVDVSKLKAGDVSFTPPPQNQRSALSLVNGTVYVAYGGHAGDCGQYRGWIFGIDAKDPTKTGAWASLGIGEGIWAAGGMASDGNGVFAITGNSTVGASKRDASDGEQVVRVTGMGTFDRNNKNLFFPTSWRSMDSADADFGASNPMYISVPGATPSNYVVAISKDGHFYLLDAANLGGSDGSKPVVDFSIATGAMAIRTVPAAYPGSSGVNVVFSTDSGAKCPANMPSDKVIMAVQVPAGSPPAPKVLWCAALSGENTSPIVTTTDGKSEPIVWFMKNGKLTALDGDTGAVLWNGGNDSCAGVRKWTSPIAVKGRIVAGADGKLCSWSVH